MNVVRASHAGFCMGVALALHKLDTIVAARPGERVATLGEIIHNPQVLEDYARKGVRCLRSVAEAEADMSVLIRAHGIPRDVEAELRRRCARVEDATCPRVKNAQLAIAEATASGRELLLYGEAEHPEVRGLISYAAGRSRIFSSLAELDELLKGTPPEGKAVVLAAQTTQDRLIFDEMHRRLVERLGSSLVVLDTICDATRERQEEAGEVAARVQAMVVAGGKSSGNTRRLAELARMRGVPTVLVETAAELNAADFSGVRTVGLTAGASTPRYIIDEVEERLRSME
ncbi:4-hydroxy-3-methylbut-2-enyl diphosphate reductase [Mailhella massiliensis]|uniref:4-hydroxy-3-methylbut-2-enyl diphosphate reductase n=1 Tax=Mailhella massiliensis TaxID=1903261 RepID=UPI0023567728|nr:4-hydroxy-3-methylbut-2-enyl diphosphate reductase [Mailhella massiliensis]